MIKQFSSLYEMMKTFQDEQSCINHLRSIRWKNGVYCPHCGANKVYHFTDNKNHKCGICLRRFSIKVGTIFEESKIPLRKWFMAIYLISSHKKGIASTQLAKDIKITQKTAWFMLQRLRFATETKSFQEPLAGPVEIDETYIGGKEKNKQEIITHRDGGYSVGDRHTNAIEGAWSLLKRGKIGIYHHASQKHLPFYLHEFSYRYNTLQLNEGQRVNGLLGQCAAGALLTRR
ncbi:IS1595 family transposase [Nitrospira sp. MA-1]|nr:IS1595 family transposase [Nitrospira sp. MA-1]